MKEQRRGKRIAMSPAELHDFLLTERTCRVATVGSDSQPHNTPLWFVWDGKSLWLNSIVKSQRWTDIVRRPRVSVLIDAGHDFGELRGAELLGSIEQIGESPRTERFDAQLEEPERLFGAKYAAGVFQVDGRHAWLRLRPEKVVSWDFRKMGLPPATT
jgi:hypothetical protein